VAAKKHSNKLSQAVMLLSEFSGSNPAFKGFLEYNPFNVSEFLTKLDYCLSMSPAEKEELMKQAVSYLEKASTSKWVESYLRDLKIAHKPRSISYYLGAEQHKDSATNVILRSDMRMLNFQMACD
jgi:trehalose-6-phosphate synthase